MNKTLEEMLQLVLIFTLMQLFTLLNTYICYFILTYLLGVENINITLVYLVFMVLIFLYSRYHGDIK